MKRLVIIGVVAALTATIASLPIVVAGALPWSQEDTDKEMSHARGWLGVRIAQINQSLADKYDLTVDSGVVVVQVQDGGPADAAGVEVGDVFKTIDDTPVEEVEEVVDVVSNWSLGRRSPLPSSEVAVRSISRSRWENRKSRYSPSSMQYQVPCSGWARVSLTTWFRPKWRCWIRMEIPLP